MPVSWPRGLKVTGMFPNIGRTRENGKPFKQANQFIVGHVQTTVYSNDTSGYTIHIIGRKTEGIPARSYKVDADTLIDPAYPHISWASTGVLMSDDYIHLAAGKVRSAKAMENYILETKAQAQVPDHELQKEVDFHEHKEN